MWQRGQALHKAKGGIPYRPRHNSLGRKNVKQGRAKPSTTRDWKKGLLAVGRRSVGQIPAAPQTVPG